LSLAEIQFIVGGKEYSFEVAVTGGLTYGILLGRDITGLSVLVEKV